MEARAKRGVAAGVAAAILVFGLRACRAIQRYDARTAEISAATAPPPPAPAPQWECGGDRACVSRLARAYAALAADAGAADEAEHARRLAEAMDDGDCRSALAHEHRLEPPDGRTQAARLLAQVHLATELANTCILHEPARGAAPPDASDAPVGASASSPRGR